MDREKVTIDSTTFKFLYKKYKEFTLPFIVFVVCTALLFTIIVPQFQNLFDSVKQIKELEKNLEVLKSNYDLLSTFNDETLDSQLKTVVAALPASKDFIGIINAINYAELISGVGVGDFQLSIGELFDTKSEGSGELSSISMNLSVKGEIEDANKFVSALYATLPLSEVTSVNVELASSDVMVNFYYKPVRSSKDRGIFFLDPINSKDLSFIKILEEFNYEALEQSQSVLEVETSSF